MAELGHAPPVTRRIGSFTVSVPRDGAPTREMFHTSLSAFLESGEYACLLRSSGVETTCFPEKTRVETLRLDINVSKVYCPEECQGERITFPDASRVRECVPMKVTLVGARAGFAQDVIYAFYMSLTDASSRDVPGCSRITFYGPDRGVLYAAPPTHSHAFARLQAAKRCLQESALPEGEFFSVPKNSMMAAAMYDASRKPWEVFSLCYRHPGREDSWRFPADELARVRTSLEKHVADGKHIVADMSSVSARFQTLSAFDAFKECLDNLPFVATVHVEVIAPARVND